MLRPTLVRLAHTYKPMMRFPDRKAPKESHAPRPHPDAPQEIVENFDHYKKLHDSGPHFDPEKLVKHGGAEGAAQGEPVAADETSTIYDLPSRFWDTPSLRWSPAEMEAINSGGSSMLDA